MHPAGGATSGNIARTVALPVMLYQTVVCPPTRTGLLGRLGDFTFATLPFIGTALALVVS